MPQSYIFWYTALNMRTFNALLLTTVIWISLQSSELYATSVLPAFNTNQRCLIDVPIYDKPLIDGDTNDLPIKIETDALRAQIPNKVIYQGNVRVQQGNRYLRSEQLVIETRPNNTHFLTINANIDYLDTFLKLHGKQASMTIENGDIDVQQGQYHLVNRLGRGKASKLSLKDNRYVILEKGSFTTCPIGDNSWSLTGTTIVHDNQEQLLEVWNAIFKLGPVPVLYSPYIQYPTGNKRRSGLLMPSINYNSIDGYNVAVPFYWNIAPTLDATITPRLIQHRGLQLQSETRYLNNIGLGTLAFDWFNYDRLYNKSKQNKRATDIGDNAHRWLFHWNHHGVIDNNWRINANMTRVSDRQYLVDLDSGFAHVTDGYLTQRYQMGYANDQWDISLSSTNFQVFRSRLKKNVYRTEPQLDINYYYNASSTLRLKSYVQLVNFISPGKHNPQTMRAHFAPTLSYLLSTNWGSLNSEATLLATHYYQDLSSPNYFPELTKHVSRIIPKFTFDGHVIFQRDSHFMGEYTQTLEPQIKYQYIPYRNQYSIKNYDSALLQLDYFGLFRDQIYSGLDRIASANQLSTGIASRFYDQHLVERFNFALGQIYYFNQSRTGDTTLPTEKKRVTGSVSWATNAFWRLAHDTVVRGSLQYDTRVDELSLANGIFEYKPASNKVFQLSYRYASENYIDSIDVAAASPYKQAISQLGAVGSYPFSDAVAIVGGYYYDTKLKQSADSFIGLQYNNCCWGFNALYGRQIVNWNNAASRSDYDNKLSISFELRGFGRNRNNIAKMLNFGLLPYRTALE